MTWSSDAPRPSKTGEITDQGNADWVMLCQIAICFRGEPIEFSRRTDKNLETQAFAAPTSHMSDD